MYKKIIKKSGFTLVELVVVATILAILWAVGFSAYTWYIAW
jgi:prepilin-type N-terminal cleavage/methylation domain-containing protein